MATLSYHEQKDIENIKKLRELQKELPSFCSDFFRGIETSTSTRTRIAYAYDLKIFFQFLKTANPGTFNNPAHTLTPADLEKLTVTDLEEYIDYLKCHPGETSDDIVNTERGLMRKVSSLRSFYSYFFRNEQIEKNPAALVRMPKLHEKEIIRLEIDEVAKLLDEVEEGDKLTEKQKLYHERTKVRDDVTSSRDRDPCLGMRRLKHQRCGSRHLRRQSLPERRKRIRHLFQRRGP